MASKIHEYVSCIKILGVSIVPPFMTNEKRQEMKEYKEKALVFEQKIKGKRVSLDSGVMTASTEMQKIDSYESPTCVSKEPNFCNENNSNILPLKCSEKNDGSTITPETLADDSEENSTVNLNDICTDNKSITMQSENTSSFDRSSDTFYPKQEPIVTESDTTDKYNLKNSSPDSDSVNMESESINSVKSFCDTLTKNQESASNFISTNSSANNEYIPTAELTPRVRSNSYTLSSPSPVMVAFLNSQIQKHIIEPKCLKNDANHSKESKSEPPSVNLTYDCDDEPLKTKSISYHSIPEPFVNHNIDNLDTYRHPSVVSESTNNTIISEQNQDEKESLSSIGTNFSNDESVVDSVKTVFNSNIYENNSGRSSATCKLKNHCPCSYSDDDYSLSSKTSEELNLEAERLRLESMDIDSRHLEEMSNLLKVQKEEKVKIALQQYFILQSLSGMSECSQSFSKQLKCTSSTQSGTNITTNSSVLSDMSIISNSSNNENFVSSSPRPKKTSSFPYLQQNYKLNHRIVNDRLTTKWSKAPTEIKNAAATTINAYVRGYLTRRLLRTEKALMLKKTILDSLKTALIMHMDLKNQQPTESDLDLHQRIINQLTTACYDLNDLILGSVQERMSVIRGDRELITARIRRKSSSALVNKPSQSLKQPKKSISSYSLSRKSSINSEKRSYKK